VNTIPLSAFSKNVLQSINYQANSDDFVFDMNAIANLYGCFEIAEGLAQLNILKKPPPSISAVV